MKKPNLLFSVKMSLSSLTLLSLFFSACTNNKQQDQLAGMYKLHIMENQDSLGNWYQDEWAKDGTGYIIYDGLGHMAVQITPKGYKDFEWMSEDESPYEKNVRVKLDTMSLPELKEALNKFSSSYVYVANYSIDDTANIVQHDRISSTLPAVWGTSVRRAFSFNGDTLILRILNGNRRLKWIRQN